MNPVSTIAVAAHTDHLLILASQRAETEEDWRAINAVASNLLHGLAAIENNSDLRPDLRQQAGEKRAAIRFSQRESFARLEAFRLKQSTK